MENGSEIDAYAEAYDGSGDATATVDIDAGGNVLVEEGEEEDADARIWAEAYTGAGEEGGEEGSSDADATATVRSEEHTSELQSHSLSRMPSSA